MATRVFVWRTGRGQRTSSTPGPSVAGLRGLVDVVSHAIGGFGHVALEADRQYLSYWPSREEGEVRSLSLSHEEDLLRCERPADTVVSITGLNENAMIEHWHERSDHAFENLTSNCSTLAVDLLFHGYENMAASSFGKETTRLLKQVVRAHDLVAVTTCRERRRAGDVAGFVTPKQVERVARFYATVTG